MSEMSPERLAYEMSKIPTPKPRYRLSLQDFEKRGIDVIGTLWETIGEINDPSVRVDKILKIMGYMFPKIDKVQINNIQSDDTPATFDLSKVSTKDMIRVLKEG